MQLLPSLHFKFKTEPHAQTVIVGHGDFLKMYVLFIVIRVVCKAQIQLSLILCKLHELPSVFSRHLAHSNYNKLT